MVQADDRRQSLAAYHTRSSSHPIGAEFLFNDMTSDNVSFSLFVAFLTLFVTTP
jgi:hypothetical protein